jgi:hypothetical protein
MRKPCGDGTDDTNSFAVVQMPDVRVLASHVFLADDKKNPQDANAKAEEQAAKQRKKLEAELKSAQDRLNHQNLELEKALAMNADLVICFCCTLRHESTTNALHYTKDLHALISFARFSGRPLRISETLAMAIRTYSRAQTLMCGD